MADDNMSVKNLSEKDEAQLKDLFRFKNQFQKIQFVAFAVL